MPSTVTLRQQGLNTDVAVKGPVLVASTGDLTLSSTQIIDGIAVSSCDRVLAKDQATQSENGIYIADTGDWTRAKDFDGTLDVVRGTLTYVSTGAIGGGRFFVVTSTGDNIPGTNAVTFAEAPLGSALAAVLDTAGFAINESEGTAVIASSNPNIWQPDGNTVHLTSSTATSISSFSTAPRIGALRRVVADTSGTLVHSTTSLILPSSANADFLVGDVFEIYAESTTLSRLTSFLPADGRDISAQETISSGGAFLRNSGVSLISSDSTSGMAALRLRAPVIGSHKEIVFLCSATTLTLNTTGAQVIHTGSTNAAVGTTALSFEADNLFGTAIVLRGISSSRWQLVQASTVIVSS